MVDPAYEGSWPHLECARLEVFSRVDNDACTVAAPAHFDGEKICAWCTKDIIFGEDWWQACWMGWVHAECDAGRKADLFTS